MDLDEYMRKVAGEQHSLITREQALALSSTRSAVQHRVAGPEWEALSLRVFRLSGSVETPEQRVMAAVLDAAPGAVASHETALALVGLPGFDTRLIHVTRPRQRHKESALAVVHQALVLPPSHLRVVRGIPMTSAARGLVDAANDMHPLKLERAVGNAVVRRMCTFAGIERIVDEVSGRRHGAGKLREVLAGHTDEERQPESGLEARFLEIARCVPRTTWVSQVDIGDDGGWVGRVDFNERQLRIVWEVDSDLYHTAPLDQESDEIRDERLRAAGWIVGRSPEFDVWHRRDKVLADLRAKVREAHERL